MAQSTSLPVVKDYKLVKLASKVAVGVAAVMVAAKFFAWLQTDSLSLQASLVDSLLDIMASILNLVIIRQAVKPADDDHRFGHGKAEALGGLAQTAFIAGSAGWLLIDVAHRLISPHPLHDIFLGNVIMAGATVVTGALVLFQRWVVNRTGSIAIRSDSLHYETDFLANIGVLISLNISSYFHWVWFDALVGGGIALYIFLTSYKIALNALDILMDKELGPEIRQKIKKIVRAHPKVLGVHDVRTRSAVYNIFIQMHLDLDKDLKLEEAHDIGDEVEEAVQSAFPNAEIIIHLDPYPLSKL